jgi:hypothetical protein
VVCSMGLNRSLSVSTNDVGVRFVIVHQILLSSIVLILVSIAALGRREMTDAVVV